MNKKEARDFLITQAGNVLSAIRELTMEELLALKKVVDNYSSTNCWYAEYWMKDSFVQMINDRISFLQTATKSTGNS